MVDPITNGADIEIPVLIVGAGPAGLSSRGWHRARLADLVNRPATR
jgi:ribulose 1,5-bisphosphate synthetase/thiazole synthase